VGKSFRLQEQKDIENVRNTLKKKQHCHITFLIVTFTKKEKKKKPSFWLKTKLKEERVYKQNTSSIQTKPVISGPTTRKN
jgi:hypothetical protein